MQRPGLWAAAVVASVLFLCAAHFGAAQEKSASTAARMDAYDTRREVTIVGTVVKYGPSVGGLSGPQVRLQTTAGMVDVHLGDARLLAAKHFEVQNGDTLRIVGENVSDWRGTRFMARVVQNGVNAVEVRSARGIPLSNGVPVSAANKKGGAL